MRETRLHGCIWRECESLNCQPLVIGGIENHVHALVRMHAGIAVAQLAQQMKGASLHLVNHEMPDDVLFRWQGGYSALSVSLSHVRRVGNYVRSQKQHHAEHKIWPALEKIQEETN